MKASVQTKLGNVEYILEFEEKDEMETLNRVAVLGNPPTKCDNCPNDDPAEFFLQSNKDSEANIYVNVECKTCGARAKLGQYKAGGYFWHKFEKWQGEK